MSKAGANTRRRASPETNPESVVVELIRPRAGDVVTDFPLHEEGDASHLGGIARGAARSLEPEFVLCLAQSAADGRAVGLT